MPSKIYSLRLIWQKPLFAYSKWQVWVVSNRCFLARDFGTCRKIAESSLGQHMNAFFLSWVCQSCLFVLSVHLFFLMTLLGYNLHTIKVSQLKYSVAQISDFSKLIELYSYHNSIVDYFQYPVNFSHVHLQLIPIHIPNLDNHWSSFHLYKLAYSRHFV